MEKAKEEPQEKEECPYCGKMYANVKAHMKKCSENPNKIETPKIKGESGESMSEAELIKELRKEFENTLNSEQKANFTLTAEEQEKIEKVIKFLGGTETYQFIYKTITGDKIRGSMPYIIDQCIEWLRKHKIFILMNM